MTGVVGGREQRSEGVWRDHAQPLGGDREVALDESRGAASTIGRKPAMPCVSIVVPAYNAEAFLEATIRGVLAQTFTDFELLILDDGSTDATSEIARRHATDPRVRVIRHANRGMSATRNAGLAMSRSEFVALLDADDVWHPRKLELQLAALAARPEADLCFTEFQTWHGEDAPTFFAREGDLSTEDRLTGWIYPLMVMTNFTLPSSVLYRRRLADRLGPFLCNDHQTDDWEYFTRATRLTSVVKLSTPLVLYRQSASSLSKRMPRRNSTELMRDQLVERFGLECPHAGPVNRTELARRRRLGRLHHADGHVARGSLTLGLRAFARLIVHGPHRRGTTLTLAKSLRRRALRLLCR
jgi:glycosyltransferase involved in cell wall biosynthesis